MKKYIFISLLLLLPLATKASFDANLKYGNKGEAVKEVQEFLTDQNYYSGPITGNFFSLTLKGVKNFQKAKGLKVTGIWGQNERTSANQITELDSSNTVSLDTPTDGFHFMDWFASPTPPTSPAPVPNLVPIVDWCSNLVGNQTVLPDGYYRGSYNDCYPKIVSNPLPVQHTLNDTCEKDKTGWITVKETPAALTAIAKERQDTQDRNNKMMKDYLYRSSPYTGQVDFIYMIYNSSGKVVSTDWGGAFPPGEYNIITGKNSVFATPQITTLKICDFATVVIDEAK